MADADSKLRDLRERLYEEVRPDVPTKSWYHIVAAMDNIEDSWTGISCYIECGIGTTLGEKYLRIFGLFQCIYTQQDSVSLLYKQVLRENLDCSRYQSWTYLRDIRNKVFGHPKGRAGAVRRTSLSSEEFEIAYWGKGDKLNFEDVDLSHHCKAYMAEFTAAIEKISQAIPNKDL